MKFGATHRLLTSALAALGVAAILSSGALPRVSGILIFAGLIAALFATEKFQQSTQARYTAAIVPATALAIEIGRFVAGAPLLDLAVEFAAVLQIVRLATRHGATHDQQVILLALLHFVAGTVLGGGLTYGFCLAGFILIAPSTLVLSHLRREVEGNYRQGARDRTGLPVDVPRILRSRRVVGPAFLSVTSMLSLPILAFTAVLFLVFPRVGLALFFTSAHRHGRVTGLSDKVDLAEVGTIRSDPTIAMRLRPTPLPKTPPLNLGLRLRGTAFDEYTTEGRWVRSGRERQPLIRQGSEVTVVRPPRQGDDRFQIELEPLDPPMLLVPPRTVAVRWFPETAAFHVPPIEQASEGALYYDAPPDRVLRYEAIVAPPSDGTDEVLSARDRARYLQIPNELRAELGQLANDWTRGARTDRERANLIVHRLQTDYRYTLTSPSGGDADPVGHFLLHSKAGHCEFFSSAMTLLLRAIDIPARNVTGFAGGTYNRFGGFYVIRQGDAHSWVEAYVENDPGFRWLTFDPTPSAGLDATAGRPQFWSTMRDLVEAATQTWERYVVGYDLPTQFTLLRKLQALWPKRSAALTNRTSAPWRASQSTTTAATVAALSLATVAAGLWLLRYRRTKTVTKVPTASNKSASQLWTSIETSLALAGHPRPPSVAPFTFVDALVRLRDDELARTAHQLTLRYLEARFGESPIGPDEWPQVSERLAQLRALAGKTGGLDLPRTDRPTASA